MMAQWGSRRIRNNALSRCHKAPLHPVRPYARLPMNYSRNLAHGLRVRRRSVVGRGRKHGKTVVGRWGSGIELGIRGRAEGHALRLEVAVKRDRHHGGVRRGGLSLEEGTCVRGEGHRFFVVFYGGVVASRRGLLGGSRGARGEGRRVS